MKHVTVMMSTYNGEKYLKMQIDSVLKQKNVLVSLFVRDDGSSDSTISILDEYSKKGLLSWYNGKNLRPAKSFIDLVFNAPESDYYAFCDQDDFWEEEKLSRAIECLEKMDETKPLLYCSPTILVDADLKPITLNNKYIGVTDFCHAIVSSNAAGCTMCFNKILLDVVRMHKPTVNMMHDGWVHKLCLAVGGLVCCDSESHILYRQHGNNVVGGSSSLKNRWKRRWRNLQTLSRVRSNAVIEIYENYSNIMPRENKINAESVLNYRNSVLGKLKLLFNFKICFPQKKTVDFFFRLAVVLGIF